MITRFHLLLTALVCLACAPAADAFDNTYYATSSRLASGHWVKVSADHEGIFQLTYEQLQAWGFADPSKVSVYGYSAVDLMSHNFSTDYPDDLNAVPALHTEDGRLLFYAMGDVRVDVNSTRQTNHNLRRERNLYDRVSSYFLTDSGEGMPYTETPSTPAGSYNEAWSRIHLHADLNEEEFHSPMGYGIHFHGPARTSQQAVPFRFYIKNYQSTGEDTQSYILFSHTVAAARAATGPSTSVNRQKLPAGTTPIREDNGRMLNITEHVSFTTGTGYMWLKPTAADKSVPDQECSFEVKISMSGCTYIAPDYALLAYPRTNKLDKDDKALIIHLPSDYNRKGQNIIFADADAGTRLWLIDKPFAIQPLQGLYDPDAGEMKFILPRPATRAVAFSTGFNYDSPRYDGVVENQNLHGAETPDLLIITSKEYLPYANRLADLHRAYQRMDVLVVTQDEAYNEFSSGARSVMAYRRLAKMLYDRNPTKLRNLILYGSGSYDNRCIEIEDFDRLLTYQTTNQSLANNMVTSYASDNIFGMLLDDYDHSRIEYAQTQIGVGRISAINPGQATAYNNKVAARLANPVSPDVYGRMIMLSGNNNDNKHVEQSVDVENEVYAANSHMQCTQIPLILYPLNNQGEPEIHHRIMVDALQRGAGYLTYSGHGAASMVGQAGYLDCNTTAKDHYECPPFVTFASCHQFEYDQLKRSLLDVMLFEENGGAIAGIGAARDVYLEQNIYTSRYVAKAYAMAKYDDTFGDMYRAARRMQLENVTATTGNNPPLINIMAYNFAGDPALPVGRPELKCRLTAIDGEDPSTATIVPLKKVKLTGAVINSSGITMGAFNGPVRITVLDGAHVEQTYNMDNSQTFEPLDVTIESDVLGVGEGTVTKGLFTVELIVPEKYHKADSHRVIISAEDPARNRGALSTTRVKIADEASAVTFATAPEIRELYVSADGVTPSEEVPTDFMLHAVIDPSSAGLTFANTGIKNRTRVMIDGTTSTSNVEGCLHKREDGLYEFALRINGLSEGLHSIELVAANNAGLTDRAAIDIYCMTRNIKGSLSVTEPVAETYAEINLEGDRADRYRMIIADHHGNTILTRDGISFPYRWDLRDSAGNPVPDGRYTVSVLMQADRDYGHTATTQVVVLR